MRYIKLTYMCPKCSCGNSFKDYEEFSTICPKCNVEMVCVGKRATSTEIEERKRERRLAAPATIVECPYCHSINTSKIGTVSRMASTGFFGLASKKIGKQWHCNKCGSDF